MHEYIQDNFDTVDLHEQKNTRQVQIALLSLGRAAYSIPGYAGPCVGKKQVASAPRKKHTEVKIDGLWGKAGGNAPRAGYTQPLGKVDTSASVRPSANPSKARYKKNNSPQKTTTSDDLQSAAADDDDADDDAEMDFDDLDALVDSSPVPGDRDDERTAADEAEAAREAAAFAEIKKKMVIEQERVAAMEQRAAEIKRAAELEAAAIREAAIVQARSEAARIAAEPTGTAINEEDSDAASAGDATDSAAAAAELKAAAAARAKEKQAAADRRLPPNPKWVRPASAPATGPYRGNYDLRSPVDELACAWISEVSDLATATLDDLRDGVTLCELCNVLAPGAVKRINRSSKPFPQVGRRRTLCISRQWDEQSIRNNQLASRYYRF